MTPLPETPEILRLARRLIWFEPPETSLADPVRLLAYAFERGRLEDFAVLRRHLSDADLDHALRHAPPGIIGPRSWTYWHLVFGRSPPPMPERRFG
jgi:hypothetical protein